jgi:hypothetical protein
MNRSLFSKIPQFFYSPDDIGGNSSDNTLPAGDSKEDIIDFLGADDEPADILDITDKPAKGTKDKTKDETKSAKESKKDSEDADEAESEDETDDELDEIEKELEGPTEEQLELVTPVRRKEILKKYPELFKDFPYLEKAYYREQQFTELLPTIDDARIAVEKSKVLDKFESEIMGGSTENILKAVKEENPDKFHKIVDDYLPTLARVDENAYYHLLGNVTKNTIAAMVMEARKSNNEVLQSAASILNQFAFGTTDFKPPTNLAKDTPEAQKDTKKVDEREQAFVRRQFETANNDLNTKVNNSLKNTIDAHIDPKGNMSDYVKKNASKDAIETLQDLISKDTRFKTLTDKLWERAFNDNFSKESTDRIRSAFVSKAKTLLPAVIKKARIEALRGTGHRVKNDDDDTTSTNRGPVSAGRPRSQQPTGGKTTDSKGIPKGMSTLDFLNS